MTDNNEQSNLKRIQIQTLLKYLSAVKNNEILKLSKSLFPIISTQQPYRTFYTSLKNQVSSQRKRGASFQEISSQIVAKAFTVSDNLGDLICILLEQQPQFLSRFQLQQEITNQKISIDKVQSQQIQNVNNDQIQEPQKQEKENQDQQVMLNEEEKVVVQSDQNENNEKQAENIEKKVEYIPILEVNNIKEATSQILPPIPSQKQVEQNLSPVLTPIRNESFVSSPLMSFIQQPLEKTQKVNEPQFNKISQNPFQEQKQKPDFIHKEPEKLNQQKNVKFNHQKSQEIKNFQNKNRIRIAKQIDYLQNDLSLFQEKPQKINKMKNDAEKIISIFGDPLSQGRPASVSPVKKMLSPAHLFQQKIAQLPKSSQKPSFFTTYQQQKTRNSKAVDKYFVDKNLVRNLSNKQMCICETACQNIVLSQDSFLCVHCQNIYHTRCMKKTKDSKNCCICQLRLMIPNKVVCQQLFVGLMKKGRKQHEIVFQLSQQVVTILRSKKQSVHKLQLRSFRIKQQTQNQNLFPDSCTVSINGKQLNQYKPLHKQSSLKYRKDEPLMILKNFQTGQNKLSVTEFHNSSNVSIQRIEPQDHLIGVYIIEEEQLNATVERIVANYMTTLRQSRAIINKSFYINEADEGNGNDQDSQAISCEVVKIPLTCALTTEKLIFPARGIFCQHFQCFDLKNFIMMTSSSSNPRWVCPVCKASCYQFRVDCVLTEILKQYKNCNKVQTLILYKNGIYEVLDKEQDPIDTKGNKLRVPLQKNISELKIVDVQNLKREREKQAEKQLIKEEEQKKKKRIVELPPQDQIVSLLSDSQDM